MHIQRAVVLIWRTDCKIVGKTFHKWKGTNKKLHIQEMNPIFTLFSCIYTDEENRAGHIHWPCGPV